MNNRNPFRPAARTSHRHRVFVSYYHYEDQRYRDHFERLFSDIHDILVSESVEIGDIDPNLKTETIHQKIRDEYLRDSTVTVVLIGAHTWQRKFVDWEIGSSIRKTPRSSRSGLLGILLPSSPNPPGLFSALNNARSNPYNDIKTVYCNGRPICYDYRRIPPRLHDNIECGFATLHNWSDDPDTVQSWIHEAFKRRNEEPPPDNSRDSFKHNRSGERWSD